MLKKILILSIFFGLISCFSTKNEFKMPRFTTVGLSSYKEKCILEDSIEVFNGFYKLVINEKLDKSYFTHGVRENYLVFFSSGKVGRFLDYNEKSFDFNPKKAEMGYYGKKNDKYFMKSKVKFQGSYNLVEDEIVFINKDSLITYSKPGAGSNGFYSKYIKVYPKTANNRVNPDW